ncbi:PLDc N-terminal domain-containing protein [Sanguibacter massiliensis]|uniref:PLDc N-terminal domain-containing protein n=1 Tax=Sanguibacter massiliensis TaxID=1973217 RepID=UPI000C864284|nr:PLDc N-terminal domain-containing protein [Sanguibacter massiliensis]
MRYLGFLLLVAVVVYTVTDIINAPDEDLHGLPRGIWLVLVVLIPVLGSVVWFAVSVNGRRSRGEALGGPRSGPRTAPGGHPAPGRQGPLAPDDDPEFLWRLEQERRRRAGETGTDGSTPPTSDDSSR